MDAQGKSGKHESIVDNIISFLSALQTSQVHP